ncbi:hypothetical protein CNR22_17675 [Sphingobacteriaceae bacterium]|nr:hypothetical protein CNR22_17675 [Sphingobacteriaceae bacterium]
MEAQINALENMALAENRLKWFMEMLAIKRDAGMTRIYSAISTCETDSKKKEAERDEDLNF